MVELAFWGFRLAKDLVLLAMKRRSFYDTEEDENEQEQRRGEGESGE